VLDGGSALGCPLVPSEAIFSNARRMMEKVGISTGVQAAIMANHEPKEKGIFPGLG
jgi:hypothetical protein